MSRKNRKKENNFSFTPNPPPRNWEITFERMDQAASIYNNLDFFTLILLMLNLCIINIKGERSTIKDIYSLIGLILIGHSLFRRIPLLTASKLDHKINSRTTLTVKTNYNVKESQNVFKRLMSLSLANFGSLIFTLYRPSVIDLIVSAITIAFPIFSINLLSSHDRQNIIALWAPEKIKEINNALDENFFEVFSEVSDDLILLVNINSLIDKNSTPEKIEIPTVSAALEQTCFALGIQCIPIDIKTFIVSLSYQDEHLQIKLNRLSESFLSNLRQLHQIKSDEKYINNRFSKLKIDVAAEIGHLPSLLINREGSNYQQQAFDYISKHSDFQLKIETDAQQEYLEISSPINRVLWKKAGEEFTLIINQQEKLNTPTETKDIINPFFTVKTAMPTSKLKIKTRSSIPDLSSTSLNLELKNSSVSWLIHQHEFIYSRSKPGNILPYQGRNHHLAGSYFLWDLSIQDDKLTDTEYKKAHEQIMLKQTCHIVPIYIVNNYLIVKGRLNNSDYRVIGVRHPDTTPKLIHWMHVIDHATELNKNFALQMIQKSIKKISAIKTPSSFNKVPSERAYCRL